MLTAMAAMAKKTVEWHTPEMEREDEAFERRVLRPEFRMWITVFASQSGHLLFVSHGGEGPKIGVNQRRGMVAPMALAATEKDYELIAEALLYEGRRYYSGGSRAGQLAQRITEEMDHLAPRGRSARRRASDDVAASEEAA